jgi:AcrR family transcriptional regulator
VARSTPVLHRDDPDKDPLGGHAKVTRQDWLNMARDILVTEGVAEVKILTLSTRMGVSRSSFYWYFENRSDLLAALLAEWEARNTAQIVAHCRRPSGNITQAVCTFFCCFLDPSKFDHGLDFAVREWARRDDDLRGRIDAADATRLEAVTAMFETQGYPKAEADARARILYFMQLGYHALQVRETITTRLSRVEAYLLGFTGQAPDLRALRAFFDFVEALGLD